MAAVWRGSRSARLSLLDSVGLWRAARPSGVRISRLAQGVPIGGELDYLDEGTPTTALKARLAV
jgi:recombinational DNA repair protein RecR